MKQRIKSHVKKEKRRQRKKMKPHKTSIRFLGVNANGLKPRFLTFKKVMKDLTPSVFFVEETKFQEEGELQLENFMIFELTRASRDGGGGLALGVVKELCPVLVRKGDDKVEAMSIDILVKNMRIRCCIAYGCQESSHVEKKDAFWTFIEEEAKSAWSAGSGFILHFDGNLWAGSTIIPGDPIPQNNNGKLFQQFLERNSNLNVVNALPICEGLITRNRLKNGIEERSVLDFFVVCSRILPFVSKMIIDEDKNYILTNYKNVKKGQKAVDSDHFTQYMDLDLQYISEKPKRREIFNLKNKKSQAIFKSITSSTSEFSECFNNDIPFEKQIENWRFVLKSHCQQAFKKIRIKDKKDKPLNKTLVNLVQKRNKLKATLKDPYHLEIQNIEREISSLEAEENRKMIIKHFKEFGDNTENINLTKLWKVFKKIGTKNKSTVPVSKKDHKGNLITDPKEIKELLATEYKQRLRDRPVRPDLGDIRSRKQEIFKLQLELSKGITTDPWDMKDLEKAIGNLKNNKSRDHSGYANEIFKNGVIGSDLKLSLLIMCNKIKQLKVIPKFMRFANITTVPKKGSMANLENERGIFRVDVIRSILMRLIYNEKYLEIDKNISDSQMGGRKGKGCRNNIFILNGIIHDVVSSNKKPIMLQFYDYKQMFDSMNLKQAIIDIHKTGLKDDNLSLIYEANKEIFMAVNTQNGLTDRHTIENCVLQGDTWSSLLASVQVDTIARDCIEAGYEYRYKESLPLAILGLVDDTIGVTEAGHKALMMNAFLNVKTAEKSLQFGVRKCKSMLVGKDAENIFNEKLVVDSWSKDYVGNGKSGEELVESYSGKIEIEKVTDYKYLGYTISNTGNNMQNIKIIKNKSIGTIRQIFHQLKSLKLGKYYFEVGLLFLNVMLRSTILYACETYYNLKESEIRQLERIEETYMRKLVNTTRGCPIIQLYCELGQVPARFHIMKQRLNFLKYILNQDTQSMIYKVLFLQVEKPVKFDWAGTCIKDLKKLKIHLNFEDIRKMPTKQFKEMIKKKCEKIAYEYLMEKRKSKGSEIKYVGIETAEYFMPSNDLNIEEKQKIFSIRNRMVNIPSNFISREKNLNKCICNEKENMEHIYNCNQLNNETTDIEFKEIFGDNRSKQKKILNRFENNLKTLENQRNHVIPCGDPPVSVTIGNCNG